MSLVDKLSKPASVCALAILGASATPAVADSLSRSVDVNGTPAQVWSKIGPFCASKDWHPAIGSCTEDGKSPPTRTLVTKDGKATFVELQVARSDKRHFYTYTFVSSPLPVKDYSATIRVTAKGNEMSTVTWSGEYTPAPAMETAAKDALGGIYESGLNSIKAMFEKRVAE